MSGIESLTFGGLWAIVLVVIFLLLLLYRQVDRAYRDAGVGHAAALAPGTEAPPIDVLDEAETVRLDPGSSSELTLLAFVSTECASCRALMDELTSPRREDGFAGAIDVLVSGEGFSELLRIKQPAFRVFWVAHPPDVVRAYGVTRVPLGYVLRGRTVVASLPLKPDDGLWRDIEKVVSDANGAARTRSTPERIDVAPIS